MSRLTRCMFVLLLVTRPVGALSRTMLDSAPAAIMAVLALHEFGLAYIFADRRPTFPTSLSYAWMQAHGTEDQWSERCLAAAFVAMLGCLPLSSRRLPCLAFTVHVVAAILASLFEGMLSVGYFRSSPNATGWWTYAMLVLLAYWALAARIRQYFA